MTDKDILILDLNDISEILNNNGYGGWCVAIQKAVALLKEQEAKPVKVCGQMFTVKYGHCPTCGKGMDSDTYPHWCGFCGQAVKW